MNGYISIIKYYPDNNRDEGFGVGIILISEEITMPLVRISKERLKRINSAFGLKKSILIESTIEEILSTSYDKSKLDYLSVYENGNLRYTKPQIIDSDNLIGKFEDLYIKLIAEDRESFEND
jgi:hypothetical protein